MSAPQPLLLGALATALLAASALPAAEPLKRLGQAEGQLDIIAWPGYIERGETDKNYDWVTHFEKDSRLQGQRQDRRHLRRDGQPDEPRAATTWSPPRAMRRCAWSPASGYSRSTSA